MLKFFALFLLFVSVSIFVFLFLPGLLALIHGFNERRAERLSTKMDDMFVRVKRKSTARLYVFAPFILGFAGFLFTPSQFRLAGVVLGIVLGFIFPSFYIRFLVRQRKRKFYAQFVDALLMMNSGLKGGLSLLQAMEVVADEMPEPISQEFAILIGENKMGVSLEASFDRLFSRLGSPALQQFISAVLLARETGGNLPIIFNRIIQTIRENRKIQQNIETLTVQGKIQGVVMSLLPIVFALFIFSSNPHYFDVMLDSVLGRKLLILAAGLETVGAILILKFSRIGDF
ncbi:MAG: type II secretion system F family protein [Candidatus Omnitrophica bacterium]|nr:type II secretion system F family protein [Candidatus Omnitrophota bacterium]